MTSNRTLITQRFFAKNLLGLAVAGTFLYASFAGATNPLSEHWTLIEPSGGSQDYTLQVGKIENAETIPSAATMVINGNLAVRAATPNVNITRLDATKNLTLTVNGNLTGGVPPEGAEEKVYLFLHHLDVSGDARINNRFSANSLKVDGNLKADWTLDVGHDNPGQSTVGGRLETGQLAIAQGHTLIVDTAKVTEYISDGGNITGKHGLEIAGAPMVGEITVEDGNLTLGLPNADPLPVMGKSIVVQGGNIVSHIGLNVEREISAERMAHRDDQWIPVPNTGNISVTGDVTARNIVANGTVTITGDVRTQSIALGSEATFGGNVILGTDGPEYGFLTIGGNTSVAGNLARLGGFQFADGLAPDNYTFTVDGNIEAAQSLDFTDAPNEATFDINVGGSVESTGIDGARNLTVGKDLKVVPPEMGDQLAPVQITGELNVGGNMSAQTVAINGGTIGGRLSASSLRVENAPLVITGGTVDDTTINLDRSTITTLTLNKAGESSIAGGLTVNALDILNGTVLSVDDLQLIDSNSVIHVGKSTDTVGGAKLIAGSVDLKGGQLILDPDYSLTDTKAAIGNLTGTGHIVVGQNSQLTIGDTDTQWLDDAVNEHTDNAGLTAGGMTAALGIKGDVQIPAGYSITVDGSVTSGTPPTSGTPNSISFKPGSLTVVDCTPGSEGKIGFVDGTGNPVSGTIDIDTGAKLHLAGAQPGANVQLFDPATMNAGGSAWQDVTTDNSLVQIESFNPSTGSVVVAGSASASGMPHLSTGLAGILVNATNAGTLAANSFAKNALDTSPGRHNARTGAAAIEGAARMAALAAVPQVTLLTSEAVSDIVIDQVRRDGMKPAGVGAQKKPDQSLWAAPLYRKAKADGMKAGAFSYDWDADLTGIVVGGDATFTPTFRFGWQFNAGEASAKSDGDFMKTENDADFWGLGLYANWQAAEGFDVTADIGLTMLDSDVDQALVPTIGQALKAGIDSRAVTVGLRADRRFETAYGQFTPYAALRFTDIHTDSFGVMQGAAVIAQESVDQRLWTFPIGVAYQKSYATQAGWFVTPKVDVALIATAGDTDYESRLRFTGLDGTAKLDTEVADDLTGAVKFGLSLTKDKFAVGFDYAARVGSDSEAHRLSASVNWLF